MSVQLTLIVVRHRYKLGLRRANQIGRSRSSRLPILLASSYVIAFRSASPSGTEIVTRSRGSAIPSLVGLAPHKSRRLSDSLLTACFSTRKFMITERGGHNNFACRRIGSDCVQPDSRSAGAIVRQAIHG